jgi:hypothetical protein
MDGDGRTDLIVNELAGNGRSPAAVDVGNLLILGPSIAGPAVPNGLTGPRAAPCAVLHRATFSVWSHRGRPPAVLRSDQGRGGTTMALPTTGDHRATARPTSGAWRRIAGLTLVLLASDLACADRPPPQAPDAPAGEGVSSEHLGAPYDTHYEADIEATRGRVRVVVREQSVCDVIPVQSVIVDGKKKFIAGNPVKTQPCNERVARNVILSLEVDGNTFRLGEPDDRGELDAQLGDRMLEDLYGDANRGAPVAKLLLRDRQGKSQVLGDIELRQLRESDRRLDELLAEFRRVLDRPQTDLTGSELARAYELYEQLARFDSGDPRIGALQALFMERLYQRKAIEANQRFRNNLAALGAAKDILNGIRTTIVLPGYVSQAIDGGVLDDRSVDWARGQVAIALRRNPTLCGPSPESGFTWSRLQLSPPPPESRLAFELLRFAYDDPYEKEIADLCRRVLG